MKRYGHWIDGGEQPGSSGDELGSYRPGTDDLVCSIAAGNSTDVGRAAEAAAAAWHSWASIKPIERGRVLAATSTRLRAQAAELVEDHVSLPTLDH